MLVVLAKPQSAGTMVSVTYQPRRPRHERLRLPAETLDGKPAPLADWRGQVLLIVNTASKCGFTPQYAGLEALYRTYKDRGFSVIGFPCNQFGAQEPGERRRDRQLLFAHLRRRASR